VSNAGKANDTVTKFPGLLSVFSAAALLLQVLPLFAQTPPGEIFTVGRDVTAPGVIQRVEAKYTDEGLAAGISGVVRMECIVRKDGSVSVTRIIRGLDAGLDENARAALEQWRFSPAMRQGQAVDVRAVIDIEFSVLLEVGGDVQPPVENQCPKPEYTDDARQSRISGSVGLQFVVDYEGKATVRNVIHSLGHGLDESARSALEKCRFTPATRKGRPVSVLMETDYQFDLQ
jgi:TonB family protein